MTQQLVSVFALFAGRAYPVDAVDDFTGERLVTKPEPKPVVVTQTVVALDAPKVYGARSATVATKPVKTVKKPATPTSGARNPDFGVKDVVAIRRSVYRKQIAAGMSDRDAKLFSTKFVMRIVLAEHTASPNFKAMRDEIEAGVAGLFGTDAELTKTFGWLQATRKEIEDELVAAKTPKPAPVAHKAPEVCLPPKFNKEAIKQTLGAVEIDKLDKLDEAAQEVVSLLKGDDRYEPGERNELLAFTRDMVVGFAQVLGQTIRDAEGTADATLGALPRKPRAMAPVRKPAANVETMSVETSVAVADAKPLTKEELAALTTPVAQPVEASKKAPKAKRERKASDAELVTDPERKAASAKRQAEKEAKAKQFAEDPKAGAQPPRAPTTSKKDKGDSDSKGKGRGRGGKKGQQAEARA